MPGWPPALPCQRRMRLCSVDKTIQWGALGNCVWNSHSGKYWALVFQKWEQVITNLQLEFLLSCIWINSCSLFKHYSLPFLWYVFIYFVCFSCFALKFALHFWAWQLFAFFLSLSFQVNTSQKRLSSTGWWKPYFENY